MTKKIRLLSDVEIKCISAGEVIENTSSIIKELVENSLDAGAQEITIIFKDGGLTEIVIIDDGIGMSEEDLSLALLPHATSKLSTIDKLYYENNIFFGFRGEALSAIAGVSCIKVVSRPRDALCAAMIESRHGVLFDIKKTCGNYGTTITVTDLFEHIPVRKKYLASIKQQEKNIMYVITGLVLSHPNVTFFVYKNDLFYKEYKACSDFIARAEQLVTQDKLCYIPIMYQDIYFKLEGLISFSEYGYYDRSKMFILANNRLIKQYKITQSCMKAYNVENFVKKYPELYLNIIVPPDQIDVNVHPRKEEVLFLYQKKIESLLTQVIIKVLEQRTKDVFNSACVKEVKNSIILDNVIKEGAQVQQMTVERDSSSSLQKEIILEKIFQKTLPTKVFVPEVTVYEEVNKNAQEKKNALPVNVIQQLSIFEQRPVMNYVGILANTYLVFLTDVSILCIDQHALHEKILYEHYLSVIAKNKTITAQALLFSEKLYITPIAREVYQKEICIFNSIGFYYDICADYILITHCPQLFLTFGCKQKIEEYAIVLEQHAEKNNEDKIKLLWHDLAAMYGCKNAVKAGDKLNEQEVSLLIDQAKKNDYITFCPHGRPIYYEIKSIQLDKLFKRT